MRTYVKVAWRNLRRDKLYAALNVAGLAIGIACCVLLGLYLRAELTYDRHFEHHERIYRVVQRVGGPEDDEYRMAASSPALGPMLVDAYPSVILDYVRLSAGGADETALLRSDAAAQYWDNVHFADDNIFEVFTHEIVHGDRRSALTEPGTIAISRTVAERHFGDENPVGRTLYNAAGAPLTVTLVFKDLPPNTHLGYDALIPYEPVFGAPDELEARRRMLNVVNTYTYVLVSEGYDPRGFDALSRRFFEAHLAGMSVPENMTWESLLQPLADMHMRSDLELDQQTGNLQHVYAIAAVGAFILGIACINYVNLATARATRRARAIGLRKVLGVDRLSLLAQLLGESVLLALIATLVGVIIVEVLVTLPQVSALFGMPLELDVFGDPLLAAAIVAFGVIVGLAAGAYPALHLSSFAPLSALAARYEVRGTGLRLREALVFVQFAISAGVIAATLLMTAQMRYVAGKELGYDTGNILVVPLRGADLIEQHEAIAAELGERPGVLGVTIGETIMGRGALRFTQTLVETDGGGQRQLGYSDIGDVGADYVSVLGMRLIRGRDFAEIQGPAEESEVIVNETFAREMGWDEPTGKRIGSPSSDRPGLVVGVVADFHFLSLHERIQPFAMFRNDVDLSDVEPQWRPFAERLMVIRIGQEELPDTLREIETHFEAIEPQRPFVFSFLDEDIQRFYGAEARLMTIFGIFAAVCIFVACLGLFGLSAFTTEQRSKEIGIRKVLGASVVEIVLMLSRRVLVLIVLGGAAACAAAWFMIEQWLSAFAYRAPINPAYFVLAIFGTAVVALATIALQAWRAAAADPVDAVRYE